MLDDEEVAIRVEHVSKNFILPHEKVTSVKGLFTGLAKGGRKKPKETQHALRDINIEIKKGEFFGIVGRNGSGKSTLLKMLAGIYQPTKGKIYTKGKLVPFIELGVGFNPELTGRENVYLNGAIMGFSKKYVDAMYDEIVEFAELSKFMDQKLKNYSSGMQVRLAFSMAIRANAEILVIDEVLAVGDADFQRKCFSYFKKLKKDKKTVVFVSHDMAAVREYCDRAVLIDNSRILHEGDANNIAKQYTRLFIHDTGSAGAESKKKKRWGDRSLVFGEVSISPKSLKEGDDHLSIKCEIIANKQIDSPVVGYTIKDGADKPVTGTNTKLLNKSLGAMNRGDKLQVNWKIPNIFSDGEYTIDVAVVGSDGVTIYEWWEDALNMAVYKNDHSPYAVSPEVSLNVITPNASKGEK